MKKITHVLLALFITISLAFFSFPPIAYSSKLIYTIQTGSYLRINSADKVFNSITKRLEGHKLDYLRIEKIGKYYTVRLGKFMDRAEADSYFKLNKAGLSQSFVRNAYIKKDRIVRIYKSPSSSDKPTDQTKTLPPPLPKKTAPAVTQDTHTLSQPHIESKVKEPSPPDSASTELKQQSTKYTQEQFATNKKQMVKIKPHTDLLPKDSRPRVSNIPDKKTQSSDKLEVKKTLSPKSLPVALGLIVKKKSSDPIKSSDKQKVKEKPAPVIARQHATQQIGIPGKNIAGSDSAQIIKSESSPTPPPVNTVASTVIKPRRKLKPNHERKGDMYASNKRYLLAIDEYRQSKTKRPVLRNKLARLSYNLGFVNEAISEMEKVVDTMSHNADYRITLGIYYLAKDNFDKARDQFFAALEINPGSTHAYYYLAELFLTIGDYDMAWMSIKMAKRLGYGGNDIIHRLSSLYSAPTVNPWDHDRDNVYVRVINVDTYEQAEQIVRRIAEGELFEEIANKESRGLIPGNGGFIGVSTLVEVDPKISDTMRTQEIFATPVIIKTEKGFHITQRIARFDFREWQGLLSGPDNRHQLSTNPRRR